MQAFTEQSAYASRLVEQVLSRYLAQADSPAPSLTEAMRYCVLGGKRFRAFLCYGTAQLFDGEEEQVASVAAAIEVLHSYSLVHDDLPAMDDAPLRRGRPTAHKAYGEAMAILAGDALQALAFEILSAPPTHPKEAVRLRLIQTLAYVAGVYGMAGGQSLDITATPQTEEATLRLMQKLKTGALISYATQAGAIVAEASEDDIKRLATFGHHLGLAFQIMDDVLDAEGAPDKLGKATGQDEGNLALTLGCDKAREEARSLIGEAEALLAPYGERAVALRQAAQFVFLRDN